MNFDSHKLFSGPREGKPDRAFDIASRWMDVAMRPPTGSILTGRCTRSDGSTKPAFSEIWWAYCNLLAIEAYLAESPPDQISARDALHYGTTHGPSEASGYLMRARSNVKSLLDDMEQAFYFQIKYIEDDDLAGEMTKHCRAVEKLRGLLPTQLYPDGRLPR